MTVRPMVFVTARTMYSMRGAPWVILETAGLQVVTSGVDRPLSSGGPRALLPGAVGVILGMDEVSAEALEGADALRVASMNGVGLDRIDAAPVARPVGHGSGTACPQESNQGPPGYQPGGLWFANQVPDRLDLRLRFSSGEHRVMEPQHARL